MTNEEKKLFAEYENNVISRIENDCTYWADELRLYPFPSMAQTYAVMLARESTIKEVFRQLREVLDIQDFSI